MTERFPGYDVLDKRNGPSWNEKTRSVINGRLVIDRQKRSFLSPEGWIVLTAVCARIAPQNAKRHNPVPIEAVLDQKLLAGLAEGYRDTRLPAAPLAWSTGLLAIDDEARLRSGEGFAKLTAVDQDTVLTLISKAEVRSSFWSDLPPELFFRKRLLHDIVSIYYAFPAAWNEIGFGGPASPRGYVRMGFDRRDPWEAVEASDGNKAKARKENARIR